MKGKNLKLNFDEFVHSASKRKKDVPPVIKKYGMFVSCAGILHSILARLLFMISNAITCIRLSSPLASNFMRMRVALRPQYGGVAALG